MLSLRVSGVFMAVDMAGRLNGVIDRSTGRMAPKKKSLSIRSHSKL